tara:strand:- start:118 stop:672 length:555 start_codon:yes stop_codon:yes gene_type:complete
VVAVVIIKIIMEIQGVPVVVVVVVKNQIIHKVVRVVVVLLIKVMTVVVDLMRQHTVAVVVVVLVLLVPRRRVVVHLVTVVPVNSSGREVLIRISGTSTVKVDTLRVVVVGVNDQVVLMVFPDVVVVDMDNLLVDIRPKVGRNTVWYTRAVVAVVVVIQTLIKFRVTTDRVVVVLEDTADAVVRG